MTGLYYEQAMVTIIIPSRDEPHLNKTIKDILKKATGEFEIIVHIDGKAPNLIQDKRVKYIIDRKPVGMRTGINKAIKMAKGKMILKCDAHCAFAKGFDEVLARDCRWNMVMIPRRYSLDPDTWDRDLNRRVRDNCYLSAPIETDWGKVMAVVDGKEKNPDKLIDDTMIFQGSCWIANKAYFLDKVGYLNPELYSEFGGEQMEIGLSYWLKGGQVKRNKKTWYAHLHKGKSYYLANKMFNKGYKKAPESVEGRTRGTEHWLKSREPDLIHTFDWLIDKFWPVPTWPDNWRKLW